MTNILRSLSFSITQLVYPLIKTLYEMFYDIAKTEFFSVEEIRQLSGNIYIVISVCMLFALGLKLIGAIVNPELLTDQKKGVKSVAMHSIFAVFLIVLLPIGFTKLYDFQGDIIENQLVEKIVLGADVSDDAQPGQILAAYAFYSFCQPNETISIESISNSGGDLYNRAISEDISLIKDMDGIINSKTDGKYDIEYHAILSPGVGIFLCYEMVLLCMDIALRTIKLGLLQLLTPLILCGYVIKGSEILQKWAKEVGSTYALLFLKVGMVSFMIYGLSILPGFLDKLPSTSHGLWYFSLIRVFVIIGLLQLVKQLPDIINTIFGTNIKARGGIRGRLGEMAAVGNLAQNAWDQLRQHPIQSARRALSAPVSAVGGYLSHRRAVNNRANAVRQRVLDNGGTMRQARRAARLSREVGMAGSLGAMFRAGRQGFRDGNLQGIGAQGRRYTDTHPTDSDFINIERDQNGRITHIGGRAMDNLRAAIGGRTSLEQQLEDDKFVNFTDHNRLDQNGNPTVRRMTFDELKARQSTNNAFNTAQSNIRSSIEDEMNLGTSGITFTGYNAIRARSQGGMITLSGNATSIRTQIESLKNAAVGTGEQFADDTEKAQTISLLEQAFNRQFDRRANQLQNQVMNTGSAAGVLTGGRAQAVSNELNTITDLITDNADLRATVERGNGGAVGQNANGVVTFNANFRDGARNSVSNDMNEINRSVTRHDQQIEARSTTPEGRQMTASNEAVQAHRNNGGNTNNSSSGGH